jgi:hypothetical protein
MPLTLFSTLEMAYSQQPHNPLTLIEIQNTIRQWESHSI